MTTARRIFHVGFNLATLVVAVSQLDLGAGVVALLTNELTVQWLLDMLTRTRKEVKQQ